MSETNAPYSTEISVCREEENRDDTNEDRGTELPLSETNVPYLTEISVCRVEENSDDTNEEIITTICEMGPPNKSPDEIVGSTDIEPTHCEEISNEIEITIPEIRSTNESSDEGTEYSKSPKKILPKNVTARLAWTSDEKELLRNKFKRYIYGSSSESPRPIAKNIKPLVQSKVLTTIKHLKIHEKIEKVRRTIFNYRRLENEKRKMIRK